MMPQDISSSDFFQTAFGTAELATLAHKALEQQPSPNGIPTRRLGRTNEQVSILCLGGGHIGEMEREKAVRVMHAAIDEGITFFDNAWEYGDGYAEEVMGEALAVDDKRQNVFLMTKDCERDYDGSLRNLEDSLRRLKTDYVDLWQFHEMDYDNAPDWVFEQGGMKAALEAQQAGKVRYIGFTGHKDPRIHLKMLAKPYEWATSMVPINIMDAHYRSFQNEVVPVCLEKDVGVIGMKSLGGGNPSGQIPSNTEFTGEQCIRYALSMPIATLCLGVRSLEELKQDAEYARNFQPLSDAEKEELVRLAEPEAGDGRHELFKSTQDYDDPIHRQQHHFSLNPGWPSVRWVDRGAKP